MPLFCSGINANTVQVIDIAGELGIAFSEELVARYDLKVGDELQMIETLTGFELRSESMANMASFRRVALKNREVLRRLAE
jgi:hypothetical protein